MSFIIHNELLLTIPEFTLTGDSWWAPGIKGRSGHRKASQENRGLELPGPPGPPPLGRGAGAGMANRLVQHVCEIKLTGSPGHSDSIGASSLVKTQTCPESARGGCGRSVCPFPPQTSPLFVPVIGCSGVGPFRIKGSTEIVLSGSSPSYSSKLSTLNGGRVCSRVRSVSVGSLGTSLPSGT